MRFIANVTFSDSSRLNSAAMMRFRDFMMISRHRAIILKHLRAVVDRDSFPPTEKFVMRRFVGVLKSSPTANVKDEDGLVKLSTSQDIDKQLLRDL
jgi:hypothetical protein